MKSQPEGAPKRKTKDPSVGLKPELYAGRGQNFAKHVLLKQYLTELAFKVLQAPNAPSDFLYLDAFSGPWQAQGETFEDTSFAIALRQLTEVRERLAASGRFPRMRAIFVEKKKASYERLCQEITKFPRIDVTAFNGEFEEIVPQAAATLNRDTFFFGFLDPIGWKGIALRRIAPLLRHRPGEVLVNVMTNGLVRHAENEIVQESVDELFGDGEWRGEFADALRRLGSRDEAIIELYLRRLKKVGGFTFVGSTRIRNPDKDRTYFHLAYGTRHPAGMEVFRRSEERCVAVQEQVALDSFRAKQERELGMGDLFQGQQDAGLDAFRRWQDAAHAAAKAQFDDWLSGGIPRRADHLRAELMQHPYVTATLVNGWVKEAEKAGRMTRSGETASTSIWHPLGPVTAD
ncbi:three-Cys-motif partner protein TcmP [Roseomonas sp. JC162]|uniref:Three-Cys-motif partner protein TcmP n=1 Tax=Neoroseomonas marina TaxID=1232220 RepID=A0A848E8M0_9PROT|nr:three-Cys-motif partner protein TcmP [Neoroseomonas marina]NMJ40794.1 three-Cys-motif partner protein TcmP [Neoroseomonas marina]